MTRINDQRPLPPKGPVPRSDGSTKAKPPRVTRQRRERLNRDATYLVLRDIYLEENPVCACCRANQSTEVHHIVDGVAGRALSLLNTDTWLGVCGKCHGRVYLLTDEKQAAIKAQAVKQAIKRLRR